MKRVMVFDAECSLCTGIARRVCNEAGEVIDDVWSLADMRAKKVLAAAGMPNLAKPALIEITPGQTKVFAGLMFRWRMLRLLGPQRVLRLAKVIAGDLSAADQSSGEELQWSAGRSEGVSVSGRRGFLGLMTSMATGLVIVTGLGASRLARAANERREQGLPRELQELKFVGDVRQLEGADRDRAWELFVNAGNTATLIASRDFEAFSKAAAIRSALLSTSVPETGERLRALSKQLPREEVARLPFMSAFERTTEDGRAMSITTLQIEGILISNMRLVGGKKPGVGVLDVYRIVNNVEPPELLAQITNGRFRFKHNDEFAVPSGTGAAGNPSGSSSATQNVGV